MRFGLLGFGLLLVAGCGSAVDVFGNGAGSTSGTGAGSSTSGNGGAGAGTSTTGNGGGTTTTGNGGGTTTTGNGGGTTTTGAGGGTTTTGAGGGVASPIGCSDGTREAFVNVGQEPHIAGCSGGFSVAGVTTAASMTPACGRISGNDSANPQGTGCSVEDLCAEGWHVCHGAAEVAQKSSTGQCEPSADPMPIFWITRQVQDANGNCVPPPGSNNITGCGTLGAPPGPTCAPLDRWMRYADCIPTQNWFCGNNQNDAFIEANIVEKIGSGEGGVLCCSN